MLATIQVNFKNVVKRYLASRQTRSNSIIDGVTVKEFSTLRL